MVLLFFFYGLAFFCMGLAVAIYPKKASAFSLASDLKYLAGFGLLHGANEWVDMFIMINRPREILPLQMASMILLTASFVLLLTFALRVLWGSVRRGRVAFLIFVLCSSWAAIAVLGGHGFAGADIWARYILGFPASVLTSAALFMRSPCREGRCQRKTEVFMRVAAVFFGLYAFLAGLVAPGAGFFPASVVNYSTFADFVGAPVQFFRALCAVGIAFCIVPALRIFDWEAADALRRANDELEARVAGRTADLADAYDRMRQKNQRLKEFAYIVSHDLQSPLITQASILKVLSRTCEAKLDEEDRAAMGDAMDMAMGMQTLVRSLLDFTRLDTKEMFMGEVDCMEVFQMVTSNLKEDIEAGGMAVTCSWLPVVKADYTQLYLVFQNLVGNAVKFRARDRAPGLHISAKMDGDEWLFSVADNGIGMTLEDAGRIFEVFHRAHDRGRYSGAGLGLSICKGIVERHGGRIWVESSPGSGANFFFTLPALDEVVAGGD